MSASWHSISRVILGFLFLLALETLVAAQDQPGNPDYSWLNGKWRGPAPVVGGSTEMNLQVVNDNQVKGSETFQRNVGGGRKDVRNPISGTVSGDSVELTFMRAQGQVKLQLNRAGDTLKGKFRQEEVVYKKTQ